MLILSNVKSSFVFYLIILHRFLTNLASSSGPHEISRRGMRPAGRGLDSALLHWNQFSDFQTMLIVSLEHALIISVTSAPSITYCFLLQSTLLSMHWFVLGLTLALHLCWSLFSLNLSKLQSIQDAAAHVIGGLLKYLPSFDTVHWLPVPKRIQFKILALSYWGSNFIPSDRF